MAKGALPLASSAAGKTSNRSPRGCATHGGFVRNRSNLLVLLGIAFFVVGGVIVYLLTSDDDDGSAADVAGPALVIVGSDDIPAGTLADDLIEAGRLKSVEVSAAQVTPGAIQSLNQLAGATFIQGFAADQQITSSGVQLQNRTFEVPEGFEAVAVQIDFVPGGAGYVSAGDHINLYGVFETITGDTPVPRAELLLTNVEVLDVDLTIPPRRGTASTDPAQPAAQRASSTAVTYLVAVRADDAEKVIYTTEFESLYASLTADEAPPAGPTPGRDGSSILAEEPNVAVNG
ncbi:MAG: Flp pilus assembly protein CpaB [Acidimicrobiales bacterium]